MSSNFLNSIGLGGVDIGYILLGVTALCLILLIVTIVLIAKTSKLNKKYQKFMQGSDAKSLEKDIIGLYEDNKFLKTTVDKNKHDIRKIYKNMELTFQKIGIVKYDAFQQMGGKLSFSLALLNQNNDGFILNSVHSSEGCYSYTKEVKNGECSIALGNEEQRALDMAMGLKD